MKRLAVLTVGKTHSGKSTFARALDQQLTGAVVIDQDNHAAFLNDHYKPLLKQTGPNIIKFSITETIVNYAIEHTQRHLILCNGNRYQQARTILLARLKHAGFVTLLVNFCIPDAVLADRIARSTRSKNIFRTANSFEEVFARQSAQGVEQGVVAPLSAEADYYFEIHRSDDYLGVIDMVVKLAQKQDV